MTPNARVAVLAGGLSFEREASLLSGNHVLASLRNAGYEADLIEPDPDLLARAASYEVVFMALHGQLGEDGVVQSLLELARLPYTGSGVLSSSLAWNKAVAKGVFGGADVPTPASVMLSESAFKDLGARQAMDRLVDELRLPLVVKPGFGGSALGVRRVSAAQDLPVALMQAMAYSDVVLIEQHVDGVEVAVSILDGAPLTPVEVQPRAMEYDYTARYSSGGASFYAPARLDAEVLSSCVDVAMRSWNVLGARHIARVDMIVDRDGKPWVLELATCPGMTHKSIFPVAAKAEGFSFEDVVHRVVSAALRDART